MRTMLLFVALSLSTAAAQTPDWNGVEGVFGRKGSVQGDVFKITFPRTDLKVTVGSVAVEPGLALTSWIAFRSMGDNTMLMGDLVLLDSEVPAVEKKLVEGGIGITAVHNHIINETPNLKYLHFGGRGEAVKLAETMKGVLAATATPLGEPPPPAASPATDWSKVEAALGLNGRQNGAVLQFGIMRPEAISENGMEVPPAMGMMTSFNFEAVGANVAATGDFVLLADEVNPVIEALIKNGITVTAVHNHMLFESPRLIFLHFWGYDAPERVAAGLRAALDKTRSAGK